MALCGKQMHDVARLEANALGQVYPTVRIKHFGATRFYVGIPLPAQTGQNAMLLSLFDSLPRSESVAQAIAAIARDVLSSAQVRRQQAIIEKQDTVIASYTTLDEQSRTLFNRASATANIGIWQCDLADESLYWTNGVYDIFGIPRGTLVTRALTLALYKPDSRRAMEIARARAIAECSDFSLDVEIVTAQGQQRWMRLTGAVESRNGVAQRIFGMKQDITQEKLLSERTRYLAEFDVMTGLANRGQFQAYLGDLDGKNITGLLLIDLDGFKQVNDTFGHAVGDDCIKEAALRLKACCPQALLVARIGGDEFAVLTDASGPADIETMAREIVGAIAQPVDRPGDSLTLGASVGVAHRGSLSADDLFRHADAALYAAKAAGRNTSRSFQPAP